MGDRANVYIHEAGDTQGVYLYTHWDGTALPKIVKESINSPRGQRRLDDPAYLARIIFEDMINGDLGSETGYGISTYAPDGADRIVDILINGRYTTVTLKGYPYSWEDQPADPYDFDDDYDW